MEEKIREWIKKEYECTKKYNDNCSVNHAIDRCYGVLMFAINNLFEDYNDKLGKWWDDEMLPKFRELKYQD